MHQKMNPSNCDKILVVDDATANLQLLTNLLTAHGYIVYPASDGELALEFVRSTLPDLILLDIRLPGIDGYKVCRRLKADERTCSIPIIFISALADQREKVMGFQAGAVDYITKPFQAEEVLARVRIHLQLRELTEHLEQKVADRTEELHAVNAQLQRELAERKQMEAALRQSETLLNATQRLAKIGGWDWDPEQQVSFWTEETYRIHGFTPQAFTPGTSEYIDRSLSCYDPADRPIISAAFERCAQLGDGYDMEFPFTSADGCRKWIRTTAAAVREDGRIIKVIGTIMDITERKLAEEELKKYREHLEELVKVRTAELTAAKELAEAANAFKSDFLARMSHEIRTPLNVVTGLTSIVLNSELSAEQSDYLQKIQTASHNLLTVINDILDFSKIEADRIELANEPFDLDQLLEQLADLFSYRIAQKDINLIFTVAPQVPRQLAGDVVRLTQVLTNLIENAIKFTEKGEIVVGVELADAAENLRGQVLLQYWISDTGIGIAANALSGLFEPFTQAEGYLTRKHEGTGLGLAICRRLVKLMGGRIWVESTPGKGSTFFFTVLLEARTQQKHPIRLSQDLHGLKTLVVDNSATGRRVLSGLLESFSFNVTAVGSGEKAIEMLRQSAAGEPYQLVLLDWKLPDTDGIEVATAIRNNPDLQFTPIIILFSGYDYKLVQAHMDMATVGTYLLKPIKPSQLFNTIMNLFSRADTVMRRIKTKRTAQLDLIAGRRVLVVEDNELNRIVAVALLKEQGLSAEIATDGRMAVDIITRAATGYYDAVLMDIQMPIIDGYEAARKIRKLEKERAAISGQPETRIPIIALTAHAMKGEREKCLAADMDDYLAKPIDTRQLEQVLLKWILPQ